MTRRDSRISLITIGLLAAWLAACASPTAAPQPTPIQLDLPTPIPVEAPTPVPGTADPGLAGLPADLSGYELLAAKVGTAPYSGYVCTAGAGGCLCDKGIIQTVTFLFPETGKLIYKFSSGETSGEWPMVRDGTSIWSYKQQVSEEGAASGDFTIWLEFINNGFTITSFWNIEGSLVTCDPQIFQRLAGAPSP
jgi:hypothetical protein